MSRSDPCVHAVLRDGSRWGGCLWAAAWSAFGSVTAVWEGTSAFLPAAGLVAATTGVVVVLWRAPRAGGLVALLLSLAAAVFFRHPVARWLLAAPLAVLGFASLLGAAALEPDDDPRCPRRPSRGERPPASRSARGSRVLCETAPRSRTPVPRSLP